MRKPIVGETLFLVDAGNMARRNPEQRDCVVTRVGRKYFYIEHDSGWGEIQFIIESWWQNTDYLADYVLYESRKEWEEYVLFQKYYKIIREYFMNISQFSDSNLSKFKQIIHILKIKD